MVVDESEQPALAFAGAAGHEERFVGVAVGPASQTAGVAGLVVDVAGAAEVDGVGMLAGRDEPAVAVRPTGEAPVVSR